MSPYTDVSRQRQAQRESQQRRRQGNRDAWFAGKTCIRCGSASNLRLDHRDPATKISHRIWNWPKERRETELAKCQVLCENCHRWKTAQCEELGKRLLSSEDVVAIRNAYATGQITQKALGERYGVTRSAIQMVVNRRNWKHL